MKKLFIDTRKLDKACRERYALSEELMMENAACALESRVLKIASRLKKGAKLKNRENVSVVVLCGSGNNGADGYVLARKLSRRSGFLIRVLSVSEPKSELCVLQCCRARKSGARTQSVIADFERAESVFADCDILVECVFGSGFHGEFSREISALMAIADSADCVRVACDIPAGISEKGFCAENTFRAHYTVTMGADKLCLYSDEAKDFAGKIFCANLGVSRALFETSAEPAPESGASSSPKEYVYPAAFLLEKSDLRLPFRTKNFVNKGSFGHAVIASGEKIGASIIAGTAALSFGAGLVTLVNSDFSSKIGLSVPCELMSASEVPQSVSAIAMGCGLGKNNGKARAFFKLILQSPRALPCVIDADCFYEEELPSFLRELSQRKIGAVLTPHPKEFSSLLRLCGLGDFSSSECSRRRPELIDLFCRAFNDVVLLVKGSNPQIGVFSSDNKDASTRLFVNPHGNASLAKAGSGDVLTGLICALLAQGLDPLSAALNASLAHSLASKSLAKKNNNYALTPLALINALSTLR